MCPDPHDGPGFRHRPGARGGVPGGGLVGFRPQTASRPSTKPTWRLAEALSEVGERGVAVAERSGDPGRARDVGRGRHQRQAHRAQRRRRGDGVEHEPGVHRLVAEEQVVVDLHDDEAARGQGLSDAGRQHVLAVTGGPGRQPRRLAEWPPARLRATRSHRSRSNPGRWCRRLRPARPTRAAPGTGWRGAPRRCSGRTRSRR